MNDVAQKARAAEVILHSIYSTCSWFQLFTVHREQSSDSQDSDSQVCKFRASPGCRGHLIAAL